jgi:hypothetical protein
MAVGTAAAGVTGGTAGATGIIVTLENIEMASL